jgi:hypothetical protein
MRYWAIRISRPDNGYVLQPNVGGRPGFTAVAYGPNVWTYSSLNANATPTTIGGSNPAAQAVELDLPVVAAHMPVANAYAKVYGIGLGEIAQAADLNGLNIVIYGGFAKGLPLADPSQAGLLVSGQIQQSFGNWVNIEQSLSIYVQAGGSSPSSAQTTGNPSTSSTAPAVTTIDTPANIVFVWESGQTLQDAMANALKTAFPQYAIQGAINSSLVKTGATSTGFYPTLSAFAADMNAKSLSAILGYAPGVNAAYQGVSISLRNSTLVIQDGSTQTTPRQLQIVSFIGQPTWAQPYQVQVTLMMRGDLNFGDFVTMPSLPGIISAGSASQFYNVAPTNTYASAKSGSIFSGVFQITGLRHVGNSRAADATSWITTADLLQTSTTSAVSTLPNLYAPKRGSQYDFYLPQ